MSSVVLATGGYDHTVRFWEAPSGICFRSVQYPDSPVNRLEISPDKQYLAAAGNPHIKLFEVATNNPQPAVSLEGHKNNVTGIGFGADGRWLYSCSEDNSVRTWDIRAPGCQRSFECLAPVNTIALHPNETELISGDQSGSLRVWDLRANACSRELVPEGEQAIRSVSITPDGRKVCAANNPGRCYIWRLPDGSATTFEPLHKLQAHDTYVLKCLFSPDGKLLATTSADHTIRLWRARDIQRVKTLSGHQRWVWDCAFSADSAYLVSASSDQTAKLWDLALGETIRNYTSHNKALTCVALNDVEPRAAASSDDAEAEGAPSGEAGKAPAAADGASTDSGARPDDN